MKIWKRLTAGFSAVMLGLTLLPANVIAEEPQEEETDSISEETEKTETVYETDDLHPGRYSISFYEGASSNTVHSLKFTLCDRYMDTIAEMDLNPQTNYTAEVDLYEVPEYIILECDYTYTYYDYDTGTESERRESLRTELPFDLYAYEDLRGEVQGEDPVLYGSLTIEYKYGYTYNIHGLGETGGGVLSAYVNGSQTETAKGGEEVVLMLDPEMNYYLEYVWIYDGDDNHIEGSMGADETSYTFTMPYSDASVEVSVQPKPEKYEIGGLGDIEHGTLTAYVGGEQITKAYGNTEVTLKFEPEEGYGINSLKVKNEDGGEVSLTKTDETTYTFTMPYMNVNVSAEPASLWAMFQSEINAAADGDIIKLQGDTVAMAEDTELIVYKKNITIDLNGHTIDRNLSGTKDDGTVICVYNGQLTIKDSSADESGVIKGGNTSGLTLVSALPRFTVEYYPYGSGGGVEVHGADSKLTLQSGTITGNYAVLYGGGVYVEKGTFEMQGGTISGNSSGNYGGGVYLEDGAGFVMSGGEIKNNAAKSGGGAVDLNGSSTFVLEDGILSGNRTTGTVGHGGAVLPEDSSVFTMNGGEISGNESYSDGAVYVGESAKFSLNGGKIINNHAGYFGGGVYVNDGGTFEVCGAPLIERNTSNVNYVQDDVYLEKDAYISLTGPLGESVVIPVNSIIKDSAGDPKIITINMSGNAATDNFASDKEGYGIMEVSGEAAWEKNIVISFDKNSGSGEMESVILEPGKEYTIPECTFTPPTDKSFRYWEVGNKEYHPGDKVVFTENTTLTAKWLTNWEILRREINNASPGDVIVLDKDVNTPEGNNILLLDIDYRQNITIDLNGHTIWQRGNEGIVGNNAFRVSGKLTIIDSSEEQTGAIKGGLNISSVIQIMNGGVLTLNGGTITNGQSPYGGGVNALSGSTFNMNGGTISGNITRDDKKGGGVYIDENAVFNFRGGTIAGNKDQDGNSNNLCLKDGKIHIGDTFDSNSELYVALAEFDTEELPYVFTEGLAGKGGLDNFFSDDENYAVGINADGEAYLDVPVTISFNAGEGSGTMDDIRFAKGSHYTLEEGSFTGPEDKKVIGWIVNGDTDNVRYVGEKVVIDENTELTAVYGYVPEFSGHQLVLSGSLGLKFGVKFPESISSEGSYVTFTVGTQEQTAQPEDDGDRKIYTCYLNTLQMAEEITAVLHYGDNQTVTATYSLTDYFKYFDEHEKDYNAKTLALVHAVANYGYFAYPYLVQLHHLEGKYKAITKYYETSFDIDEIKAAVAQYTFAKGINDSQVSAASYKLSLDSDTALSVMVKVPAGTEVSAAATFNGQTYEMTKDSDTVWSVKIPGIKASQLGDTITVSGTAGGNFTINVSALSYVRSVLNSDKYKGDAQNAVMALYKYYEAVKAY